MDPLSHVPSSRLLCPKERYENNKDHQIMKTTNGLPFEPRIIKSSCFSENSNHLHPLLCRNKKDGEKIYCEACDRTIKINAYYFCSYCNKVYHKECVEAPSIFHFPGHPRHPLQLIWSWLFPNQTCFSCQRFSYKQLYYCVICDFALHVACSKNPTSLTIDNPKRHKHTLHYFHRKSSLACDVCGLVDDSDHLYACVPCDVIVHKRCIDLPYVIKVSRHNHRLAFAPSSPLKDSIDCGVCYEKIDINYGDYSCVKGCVYAMHSRCALRSDVSDGKELEGEPEEEEETFENILMFEDKGDGVILHQSHPYHQMKLQKQQLHDHENKRCQACMLPFYVDDDDDDDDGNKVYRCIQHCDFFLHESCAHLPRVKQFILHVHPLILEIGTSTTSSFVCTKCQRYSCSFAYVCPIKECDWKLDVLCASICEPFNHYPHPHPLFITCSEGKSMRCSICQSWHQQPLSCVQCRFILCFRCATHPHKARYKHDEHLLVFSYKEDARVGEFYWCEICEEYIVIRNGLYACNECGVTLHIHCLLGRDPYMKFGQIFATNYTKEMIHYRSNTYPSRDVRRTHRHLKTNDKHMFL